MGYEEVSPNELSVLASSWRWGVWVVPYLAGFGSPFLLERWQVRAQSQATIDGYLAMVKRGEVVDYYRRKELGQARRAEYLVRLDHAHTLARMFWGFVAGAGFVFLMGLVAGVDSIGKGLVLLSSAVVMWAFSWWALDIVHKAERSRRY